MISTAWDLKKQKQNRGGGTSGRLIAFCPSGPGLIPFCLISDHLVHRSFVANLPRKRKINPKRCREWSILKK